jgi:hypothetical protein
MRIDSEHAVDASNDSTSRSANNPTNKATDRSEHAATGIGTAVCPVVHPARHALRLCTDRRGEKESDSNHTEDLIWSAFSYATPIVHHDVGRCSATNASVAAYTMRGSNDCTAAQSGRRGQVNAFF